MENKFYEKNSYYEYDDDEDEIDSFILIYHNTEKLRIKDFMEAINGDFEKTIAKNRFSFKKEYIRCSVRVNYMKRGTNNDIESFNNYTFDEIKNTNKFVKGILKYMNYTYIHKIRMKKICDNFIFPFCKDDEEFYFSDEVCGYRDKNISIKKFDENYLIRLLKFNIRIDRYVIEHKKKFHKDLHDDLMKAIHKRKFYKDLHDELMVVTWHPS